jgi:hypothetical protein
MANDRVSRTTAELVPLPPHTWYVRTVGWLSLRGRSPLSLEWIQMPRLSYPIGQDNSDSCKITGRLLIPTWLNKLDKQLVG